MPNDTDAVGTGDNGADASAALADGELAQPPADADKGQGQLIDGKFKSVEEQTKAYRLVEAAATKAQQEAAELKRQLAEAESKALLTETLVALKDTLASKGKSGPSEEELAKWREKQLERLRGDSAPEAVLEIVSGAFNETKTHAETVAKRETEALRKMLEKQAEEIAELRATTDPVYRKNADQINKVAKELGKSKAEVARILKSAGILKDESADGDTPPGMTAGARVGISDKPVKKEWTAEDKARFKQMGLDDNGEVRK